MLKIRPQGTCSTVKCEIKKPSRRGWPRGVGSERASQSKLCHKVELDALCQNMLKIRPQGPCSFENMGSKHLSGGVAERGWKQASQSKLSHKIELDALCQNMLKIGLQGTCSPGNMGSENLP